MNPLNKTLVNLCSRLSLPLPGFEAQQRMMPESRNLIPVSHEMPVQSAVLILLCPHENTLGFPLIKRPTYNGHHSGQIALPGGKMEASDADLIETALREFYEETGVQVSRNNVLGTLSELLIPLSNINVLPVVANLDYEPTFTPNANEVDRLFMVPLEQLSDPNFKQTELWDYKGHQVKVPFYLFNHEKVWGATAMILSELEYLL